MRFWSGRVQTELQRRLAGLALELTVKIAAVGKSGALADFLEREVRPAQELFRRIDAHEIDIGVQGLAEFPVEKIGKIIRADIEARDADAFSDSYASAPNPRRYWNHGRC